MQKIELNTDEIRKALSKTDIKLDTYRYIMNALHKTNVSTDSTYQRKYNGFYVLRFTTEIFRRVYYDYMEVQKINKGLQFEDVFKHLYSKTGGMELSFASKLLHTINPDMPIWDSRVWYHLKLKRRPVSVQKTIDYYDGLVEMFAEYMGTQNAADVIGVFDEIFGDTELTAIKKIDNAIWSLGKAK